MKMADNNLNVNDIIRKLKYNDHFNTGLINKMSTMIIGLQGDTVNLSQIWERLCIAYLLGP